MPHAIKFNNGAYYFQMYDSSKFQIANSLIHIPSFYERLTEEFRSEILGRDGYTFGDKGQKINTESFVETYQTISEDSLVYNILLPESHPFYKSQIMSEDEEFITYFLDYFSPLEYTVGKPNMDYEYNGEGKCLTVIIQGERKPDFECNGIKVEFKSLFVNS